MLLSVVIPAYNEEKNLVDNIQKYHEYLNNQNYDFEIIIVNDGSSDTTGALARKLEREIDELKLIDNSVNSGKGAAVREGMRAGNGEYLLFIDADGATSIDHLDKAWPYFEEGADVVIASRNPRDTEGACQNTKQAPWKRALGLGGNLVIQLLTVPGIWDTQCGFKIFKKSAFDEIHLKLIIDRWAFDVEMLVLANKHKHKIAKIPAVWNNAEISRVGIRGYLDSLREVLLIKSNSIRGKY